MLSLSIRELRIHQANGHQVKENPLILALAKDLGLDIEALGAKVLSTEYSVEDFDYVEAYFDYLEEVEAPAIVAGARCAGYNAAVIWVQDELDYKFKDYELEFIDSLSGEKLDAAIQIWLHLKGKVELNKIHPYLNDRLPYDIEQELDAQAGDDLKNIRWNLFV